MTYETDERLKSYLDTNQLHREQMCLAILSIDKRFTEVHHRQPRGGPDGGRDIEAIFRNELRAFAAVGFVNQANDSAENKTRIKQKFSKDLQSALSVSPTPEAFIFLTNINFPVAEKDLLVAEAKAKGFGYCEIFDRERLRIALDNPDGFSVRFQYLGILLSEEEQASFFAKWGDDIQSVISTGFQRIESTLDRILFLQEASDVMSFLAIGFELDRTFAADEIGHFRAFCSMHLKEPKHQIFSVIFGSSDKSNRMRGDLSKASTEEPAGIRYGISGGQWEEYLDQTEDEKDDISEDSPEEYMQVGSSSSIGMEDVKMIFIEYNNDSLIRFSPGLCLKDIDQAMFILMLNSSLATKVKCIHVHANEYKILEISRSEFQIDETTFEPSIPVEFTDIELSDPWVRIRPSRETLFHFSFSDQTPQRTFSPRITENSLRGPIHLRINTQNMSLDQIGEVIQQIEQEMKEAANSLNFEYAAKLRNKINELRKLAPASNIARSSGPSSGNGGITYGKPSRGKKG